MASIDEVMDWPEVPRGPRTGSVPPPSSVTDPQTNQAPVDGLAAGSRATVVAPVDPDTAVRARVNAAIVDCLILGAIGWGLVAALGAATFSGDAILLILAVQFLYFFILEVGTGQTLGKRVMNVRVVALDGSAVTMRMCAIRNVLRFIDVLPLWYASGLLSLIRTGRSRRQRIGDVVAGTTVVVGDRGRLLRTPRWLLPAYAVTATLVSLAWIAAAVAARKQALPPTQGGARNLQTVATGFAGDNSQAPAPGTWQAGGTVTSSVGDAGAVPGPEMFRLWKIARVCRAGSCAIWLTRQVAGEPPLSAELSHESDGWHATFPDRVYTCTDLDGQTLSGVLKSGWVLQFAGNGSIAQAHERNVYTPGCGWGADTVDWTARLAQPTPQAQATSSA